MVQYNKKIINNNTLKIIRENKPLFWDSPPEKIILVGGSGSWITKKGYFINVPQWLEIIIIIATMYVLQFTVDNFFRWKLNGIVFPIVFGYIGITTYNLLYKHASAIGFTLVGESETAEKESSNIGKELTIVLRNILASTGGNPYALYSMNWQKLLGALMIQFMPKMPQIPYPGFNNQPLKGVREGIQYLIIPYKFNQDDYRLKINFPKLEIPFIDPLAGICCVWEQIKKLLKLVEKAFDKVKQIVEKAFNAIKKAVQAFKEYVIDPMIQGILAIVGTLAMIPVALIYIFIGFLEFMLVFGNSSKIRGFKNDLHDTIDKIEGFRDDAYSGDIYSGGAKPITNYTGEHINDIVYNIKLLNQEEKYVKKHNKIVLKLSIYKIYKIQKTYKGGLIRFVNKTKETKFKNHMKYKMKKNKTKKRVIPINESSKRKIGETYLPTGELYTLDKKYLYGGHDLIELKKQYERIKEIPKNIDKDGKFKNSKYIQKGGGLWDVMQDALNFFKKVGRAIADIPKNINIICRVVRLILNGIKVITNAIGKIQEKIRSKLPRFLTIISDLITYVSDVLNWFVDTIIGKAVNIIQAAVDLLDKIGGQLPSAISVIIFNPMKIMLYSIIVMLKLPFIQFFLGIVDILLNIPKFFKKIEDSLMYICKVIEKILRAFIDPIYKTAKIAYDVAKAAYDAMMAVINALSSWGGGKNNGIQRLLYKNKYELNIMIKKRDELYKSKVVDYVLLDKLNKLIKEKEKRIKKLHKLLLKYDKLKQKKLTYKTKKE